MFFGRSGQFSRDWRDQNKEVKHTMQKVVDDESHNDHEKRQTDSHRSFKNDVSFKPYLKKIWKCHDSNYVQFQKEKKEMHL